MTHPIRTTAQALPTALTLNATMAAIGETGNLRSMDGFTVQVHILDSRERWGTLDLLVSPVAGEGQVWVEARRVAVAQ